MGLLGVDELLGYAIRIEERGELFYRNWANRVENQGQKKVFNFLADEESAHKKTFECMMNLLKKADSQPEGIDNQEYEEYLKNISEEILFNDKNYEQKMKDIADVGSIVDLAMKLELDSIILYSDLKKFVPQEHIDVMEKIIKEEQSHYTNLEEFKKKLVLHGIK